MTQKNKGTKYYYPEHTKGFSPVNWVNQLGAIFDEFPNVQFYWIDCPSRVFSKFSNLGYLTKEELCDRLQIL